MNLPSTELKQPETNKQRQDKFYSDMKHLFFFIMIAGMLAGCSPMDDNYSNFLEDGPVVYLAKLEADSVQVNGGRYRLGISWPKLDDVRPKKATITWANGTSSTGVDVKDGSATSVVIGSLDEASYIFEITLYDDEGNSSLTTSVTGTVYGEAYEKYLQNREVTAFDLQDSQATLTFDELAGETCIGTEVLWGQNGQDNTVLMDSATSQVVLDGFCSSSFRYRAMYKPEAAAIDTFYSTASVYALNTDVLSFSKTTGRLEVNFAAVTDDHYAGIDMNWTSDGEAFDYRLEASSGFTASVDPGEAAGIQYRTVFIYDGQEYYSGYAELEILQPVDLDRSGWSVSVSHALPADAAISNAPESLTDGDGGTCLSMVKPGKSYGGVTVGEEETVYFIIDLGADRTFDYFRILHRDNGNTNLRAQKYSFYGSDDGASFSAISEGVAVDAGQLSLMGDLPKSTYRYIKVTYDQWSSSSSTMQIAEFNLGVRQ